MSGGTVPAGTSIYSSTIASASTAEQTVFADRYGYVVVANLSATLGQLLYVRTDGTAATVGGEGCVVVQAAQQEIIANGQPLWYQSSRAIAEGSIEFGGGNDAQTPGAPGIVTPMESLAGQTVNPGTFVSVISATASLPYSIGGTG